MELLLTSTPIHHQHLNLGAVAGLSGDAGLVAALDELVDTVDAVGDLALAEIVHQVVLGNPARAGATLDALSRGLVPRLWWWIRTNYVPARVVRRRVTALLEALE